jgi:ribosomal-protein-alanine N-acetyltransferase
MANRYLIRPAGIDDLASVAAAERECFSDPWTRSAIRELLESSTVSGFLAEIEGAKTSLAGYVFGRVVAREAEVLTFGVVPNHRNRGLGGRLLDRILTGWEKDGVEAVYLEVRESNMSARRLYDARGFRVVGGRPNYYQAPREDALVLRRDRVAERK